MSESNATPWKVLIIDDEPEVHTVTKMVLAHFSFAWIEMPRSEMKKSFAQGMICNAITLIILMSTGVSYPFFRQSSSYSRIGGGKTAEKPASGAASPQ